MDLETSIISITSDLYMLDVHLSKVKQEVSHRSISSGVEVAGEEFHDIFKNFRHGE